MSYAEIGSESVNSSDDRIFFGTPVVCRLEHVIFISTFPIADILSYIYYEVHIMKKTFFSG